MATKAYKLTGQQIPQPGQVLNNAGGATWQIDDWGRLRRFLILGSEGGTYYVQEKTLTAQNAVTLMNLLKVDGVAVVELIKSVSMAGLAPSNEPALFSLAFAAKFGDDKTRKAAYDALPSVARTGTHLYHFTAYAENLAQTKGNSGWSRGMRTAVSEWFNGKSTSDIEFQLTKYQQRDGWSAADLLRLAHVKPVDQGHSQVYSWAVDGWTDDDLMKYKPEDHPRIYGMEAAQRATTPEAIVSLIRTYDLAREHIPTWALNDPTVWEALLYKMPVEAMMRNLGKMSSIGLLSKGSFAEGVVTERLTTGDLIRKSRLHPLKILVAQRTYSQGHGVKGNLEWKPVKSVTEALEDAFYMAFHNVQPSGKKLMLSLDVSGSMLSAFSGMPISAAEAASTMVMVSKRVEKDDAIITSFHYNLRLENITEKDDFTAVQRKLFGHWGGGSTDCAQPMIWAHKEGRVIDGFAIYTDNETWAGNIGVDYALARYRQEVNENARMVVTAMTSTGFSIANPNDALAMDVVGFSADTPQVIGDFLAGRI